MVPQLTASEIKDIRPVPNLEETIMIAISGSAWTTRKKGKSSRRSGGGRKKYWLAWGDEQRKPWKCHLGCTRNHQQGPNRIGTSYKCTSNYSSRTSTHRTGNKPSGAEPFSQTTSDEPQGIHWTGGNKSTGVAVIGGTKFWH